MQAVLYGGARYVTGYGVTLIGGAHTSGSGTESVPVGHRPTKGELYTYILHIYIL